MKVKEVFCVILPFVLFAVANAVPANFVDAEEIAKQKEGTEVVGADGDHYVAQAGHHHSHAIPLFIVHVGHKKKVHKHKLKIIIHEEPKKEHHHHHHHHHKHEKHHDHHHHHHHKHEKHHDHHHHHHHQPKEHEEHHGFELGEHKGHEEHHGIELGEHEGHEGHEEHHGWP